MNGQGPAESALGVADLVRWKPRRCFEGSRPAASGRLAARRSAVRTSCSGSEPERGEPPMAKTSRGIEYGSPLAGKSTARGTRGRPCEHPGCTTVLSTYNSATTCWLHSQPATRRPLDRT